MLFLNGCGLCSPKEEPEARIWGQVVYSEGDPEHESENGQGRPEGRRPGAFDWRPVDSGAGPVGPAAGLPRGHYRPCLCMVGRTSVGAGGCQSRNADPQ